MSRLPLPLLLPLLLLLLLLQCQLQLASSAKSAVAVEHLSRSKRSKFTRLLVSKAAKAKQQVDQVTSEEEETDWPIIAWKTGRDVFNIGDDGTIEDGATHELYTQSDAFDDEQLVLYGLVSHEKKSFHIKSTQIQQMVQSYVKFVLVTALLSASVPYALVITRFVVLQVSKFILSKSFNLHFPSSTQRLEWLKNSIDVDLPRDDKIELANRLNQILEAIDSCRIGGF